MKTLLPYIKTALLLPILLFVFVSSTIASVSVSQPTGGQNISADQAVNSTSPAGGAFTLLGNVVITANNNNDFPKGVTNQTIIFTAPTNWQFQAGTGTVSFTGGNSGASSILVTTTTITVTFSTSNGNSSTNVMTISGIKVQAQTGTSLPSGNITRTGGTATVSNLANGAIIAALSQVAGAAANVSISTQPTAPSASGVVLAAQPVITVKDQYNNLVSGATVTAAVTTGQGTSWALGGTTTATTNASGVATFSGLTATNNTSPSVPYSASMKFTSGSVSSPTSSSFTIPGIAPSVTPAASATVDAAFNATFTDNSTWRGAISGITVNGVSLTAGYSVVAGQIVFTPSASNPASALQTSGSKTIVVSALNYSSSTFTQVIAAGAPASVSVTGQPTAPSASGGTLATQPSVTVNDKYNNLVSGVTVTAAVTAGQGASWALGGTVSATTNTSGVATFSGLTATNNTSPSVPYSASLTFTSGTVSSAASNSFTIPGVGPSITPASGATVDAAFSATFTDNSNWRGVISGITVNGVALTSGYSVSAGQIVFTPSASNPASALQTSGSKTIVVSANGYSTSTFTQNIGPGALAKFSVSVPGTPTAGMAFNTTVIAQDQYGNTVTSFSGSSFTVAISGSAGGLTPTSANSFTNGSATIATTATVAGSQTMTVSYSGKVGTATFTVNPGAITSIKITSGAIASPQTAYIAIPPVTYTGYDAYNNVITNVNTLTLTVTYTPTGSNATGSPTTITMTNGVVTVSNFMIASQQASETIKVATSSGINVTSTFAVNDGTNPTGDYFRSNGSGDWATPATWQSSHNVGFTSPITATQYPTSSATSISILAGNTVTVSTSVTGNALAINTGSPTAGELDISSTGTLTLNGTTLLTVGGKLEDAGNIFTNTTTTGGKITVSSGGVLDINSGGTLTLSGSGTANLLALTGTLNVNSGGVLLNKAGVSNTITSSASTLFVKSNGAYTHQVNGGIIPTAAWDANSTCNITGVTSAVPTSGLGQTFGNFTWSSNLSTPLSLNAALTTVKGDFTFNPSNSASNSLRLATNTSGYILNITGDFVIPSTANGTIRLSDGSSNPTINVSGDLSISSGNSDLDFGYSTGYGTMSVSGDVNISGGTSLETSGSGSNGVINFKGTTQNLSVPSADINSVNFNINNGSTTTLANGLTLSSSSAFTVSSGGTLIFGTNTITDDDFSCTFTAATGSSLQIGSPNGLVSNGAFGGYYPNQGNVVLYNGSFGGGNKVSLAADANYIYNGLSAQSTGNLLPTTLYDSLTINNNSGVTLTQNTTISTETTPSYQGKLLLQTGQLKLTHTLTMANGSTIIRDNGTLSVAPTFNATVNVSYANLGVNTLTQTTGMELPTATTTLGNLTINKTGANITIGTTATVNGTLFLTDGLFTTTSSALLKLSSAASVTMANSTYTSTSYVNGPLQKVVGTSPFTFPVGKAGVGYEPIGLSGLYGTSPGTQIFTGEYFPVSAQSLGPVGPSSPQLAHVSGCDYWRLDLGASYPSNTNSSLPNGVLTNLTMYWNPNNAANCNASYITSTSGLAIGHLNFVSGQSYAGLWTPIGTGGYTFGDGSGLNTTNNSITYAGVSTFSPFSLASTNGTANPLPITLDYFTATKQAGYNKLTWKVECTSSSSSFDVERSYDGSNFETINTVKVSSATDCSLPFVYDDYSSNGNKVYYRIKMVDIDDNAKYSNIELISTDANAIELMSIQPNPVYGDASIKVSASGVQNVELAIIGIDGKQMQHKTIQVQQGTNTVQLNTGALAKGIYFVKGIFANGQTNVIKFVKQ